MLALDRVFRSNIVDPDQPSPRRPPVSARPRPPFRRPLLMSQDIVHVTDATFEQEVLKSPTPVLVDYWAEWCGPCKMIAPVLEDIAREYGDRVKVAKLNVDENPATPPRYGIRGIPTLILFKNGDVEAIKVGAVSKSQLSAFLDGHL